MSDYKIIHIEKPVSNPTEGDEREVQLRSVAALKLARHILQNHSVHTLRLNDGSYIHRWSVALKSLGIGEVDDRDKELDDAFQSGVDAAAELVRSFIKKGRNPQEKLWAERTANAIKNRVK